MFLRQCSRCGKVYKTCLKHSVICDDCKIKLGSKGKPLYKEDVLRRLKEVGLK